jgi:hypothetical protein
MLNNRSRDISLSKWFWVISMRLVGTLLGVPIVAGGIFLTYSVYRSGEPRTTTGWEYFLYSLVAAAIITFLISIVVHTFTHNFKKCLTTSLLLSYLADIVMAVGVAIYNKDVEFIMWFPIMIIFGIIYMFPLTFGSWLAAHIAAEFPKWPHKK